MHERNLTVGHLFRAAFETMAENYYAAAMKLDPHATWKNLVFSGGLIAQSTLLQHLIKKQFGLKARLSPTPHDTLLGLLVLSTRLSGRAETVFKAMEQVRAVATAHPTHPLEGMPMASGGKSVGS